MQGTPYGERVARLDDRDELAAHFRRDPTLHLYELGDLDPAVWDSTEWYGLRDASGLRAVCLIYRGETLPVLLALCRSDATPAMQRLLAALHPGLPAAFYAHFTPGAAEGLGAGWTLRPAGLHHKLALAHPERLAEVDTRAVESLSPDDAPELLELYARGYPRSWFDPRALAGGRFVGLRVDGAVVCAAGVHVASPLHGVAALGNVVTDPRYRGRGLARAAAGALCSRLLAESISTIGLNVRADNAPALACYRRLGFVWTADYDEATVARIT